jgi:hypothetical protein
LGNGKHGLIRLHLSTARFASCERSSRAEKTNPVRKNLVEQNRVLDSKTHTDESASPNLATVPKNWSEPPGNPSADTTIVSWFSPACLRRTKNAALAANDASDIAVGDEGVGRVQLPT